MRTTWIVLAFSLMMALAGTAAVAAPFYSATPCGGAFAPCTVTGETRAPLPEETVGLNNDAFKEFFAGLYSEPDPVFSWGIVDSNKHGYVIGPVVGPNFIHTYFIFKSGLICCFSDNPFTIADINDNDLVAVHNQQYTFSYVATIAEADIGGYWPEVRRGIPVHFTWNFVAIDNANNILVDCLEPEFCAGAPNVQLLVIDEAGATSIFAMAVLALLAMRCRTRGWGGTRGGLQRSLTLAVALVGALSVTSPAAQAHYFFEFQVSETSPAGTVVSGWIGVESLATSATGDKFGGSYKGIIDFWFQVSGIHVDLNSFKSIQQHCLEDPNFYVCSEGDLQYELSSNPSFLYHDTADSIVLFGDGSGEGGSDGGFGCYSQCTFANGRWVLVSVPEPATAAVLGAALLGLWARRRGL